MIQRLVDVLRALAAEPDGSARPADLVGELADVLLLVDSCQQEMLAPEQRARLDALSDYLERTGADDPGRTEQRDEVRLRARRAMDALNLK